MERRFADRHAPGSAEGIDVPRWTWERNYVHRVIASDLVAAAAATTVALFARFGTTFGMLGKRYAALSALLLLLWIALLALTRAYEPRLLFVGTDEYQRTLRAGVGLAASAALLTYVTGAQVSRGYLIVALVLTVPFSLIGRVALRQRLNRVRRSGSHMRRVLVLGPARAVRDLTRQLHRESYHGLRVVGACVPADDLYVDMPVAGPAVFGSLDVAGKAAMAVQADTVVALSCPELDGVALRRLAWELERDDVDLILASSLLDVAGDRVTVQPVDGLPMLHVGHARLAGPARVVKGMFDLCAAAVALVALAPLFAVIAVLIRRGSQGPAMFRQIRVGQGGQPFSIFKFRTMYRDAEEQLAGLRTNSDSAHVLFKMREDPRVTPIGRWLRRYSLDELPQILNVLFGDMSLVGPRPPLPEEVDAYPDDMRRRLVVKPGLTGLWQVSGRSDLPWEEAVRLDLRYVENWSLSLDLVILLRTVSAVWRASGAY